MGQGEGRDAVGGACGWVAVAGGGGMTGKQNSRVHGARGVVQDDRCGDRDVTIYCGGATIREHPR